MYLKKRATPGSEKTTSKLDRLITKFERVLENESVAETTIIFKLLLSESEIYFILEALKMFREDLLIATA